MMAEHGEPCGASEASFCLNGGTCFMIPSVSTPNCMCDSNYKGSRCNEMQLPIIAQDAQQAAIIAAVVIMVLLILVTLAVVIYYTCKMRREKLKSAQNSNEYWKVSRRV